MNILRKNNKMYAIVLPALGEGIEKATVAMWHHKAGDQLDAQDDVLEVVTDKATFHISAGCRGTLKKICIAEGREVAVGSTLGLIEPS